MPVSNVITRYAALQTGLRSHIEADPTTLELLRGAAERDALVPLFVLITARPEFRPPWSTRSYHGTISFAPLDRRAEGMSRDPANAGAVAFKRAGDPNVGEFSDVAPGKVQGGRMM